MVRDRERRRTGPCLVLVHASSAQAFVWIPLWRKSLKAGYVVIKIKARISIRHSIVKLQKVNTMSYELNICFSHGSCVGFRLILVFTILIYVFRCVLCLETLQWHQSYLRKVFNSFMCLTVFDI